MIYYVYAINSEERNYIYVGITNNLERRLKEHNSGNNKTTSPYLPFKLLLHEKYFKGGSGKEYLKSLI